MNDDPRYTEPNRRVYPAVTRAAILPYYKRLIRAFGRLRDMPVGVQEARELRVGSRPGMGDYTRDKRLTARTCWASTKPTTGHHKGWGRMIHDASHEIFEVRHPNARAHDGGHATLEREMAEHVERMGWAIQLTPTPKPRRSYEERIEHTRNLIDRWERKAKRAENAMKKLRRRVRALIRAQAKTNVGVNSLADAWAEWCEPIRPCGVLLTASICPLVRRPEVREMHANGEVKLLFPAETDAEFRQRFLDSMREPASTRHAFTTIGDLFPHVPNTRGPIT